MNYEIVKKPFIAPSLQTIKIIWILLYITTIINFIMFSSSSFEKIKNPNSIDETEKKNIILTITFTIFRIILNFVWSLLFFNYGNFQLSLIIIFLIIIFTILSTYYSYQTDKNSAYFLIPFDLWISVALYINVFIVLTN